MEPKACDPSTKREEEDQKLKAILTTNQDREHPGLRESLHQNKQLNTQGLLCTEAMKPGVVAPICSYHTGRQGQQDAASLVCLFLCVWVFLMHVCLYTTCIPVALRAQGGVSYPLVVSHHMDSGNQMEEQSVLLTEPSLWP